MRGLEIREAKGQQEYYGWSGLQRWTESIRARLTVYDRGLLTRLLRDRFGLREGVIVLTSSAPLRSQVLEWLVPGSVVVFNSQQRKEIFNHLPHLLEIIADSLGWRGDIAAVPEAVFDEVTQLGWAFPNQPNRDHLWGRLGLLTPDQDHPLMMALIKAWSARFFMDLVGWPPGKRPIILAFDTVNMVSIDSDTAYRSGLPGTFIDLLHQTGGVMALDKLSRMEDGLEVNSGVGEILLE